MSLSLSDWFTGASAVGTVAAVGAALHIYKGTVQAAAKPVLVFSVKYGSKWQLQNVGSGPAIDVIVYEQHGDGTAENATRCHPLAAGNAIELSWLKVTTMLTVVFSDTHGRWFTTICADSVHKNLKGAHQPQISHISHQWLQELLAVPDGSNLTERALEGKTWEELDILRNLPYAHHGLKFRSRPDLTKYFEAQTWYSPVDLSYDSVAQLLSVRERYEAHFILNYQVKHGLTRPRNTLISDQRLAALIELEQKALD